MNVFEFFLGSSDCILGFYIRFVALELQQMEIYSVVVAVESMDIVLEVLGERCLVLGNRSLDNSLRYFVFGLIHGALILLLDLAELVLVVHRETNSEVDTGTMLLAGG